MKIIKTLVCITLLTHVSFYGQIGNVGINTTNPTTTLQINGNSPSTKVEGILIPRFTGDEIYSMPIATTTSNEANLVYATSAASVANQTGRGANLKGKGFFYWDGSAWQTMDSSNVTINNLLAYVKPMNKVMVDNDGFIYPTSAFTVPSAPKLKLFDADFTVSTATVHDEIIENNPLSGPPNNFVIWDNVNHKINVPQQLLGYAITINISLKYAETTSNSDASRFVAYTGNAVYNATTGTVNTNPGTGGAGQKLKDLMFKKTKTSGFTTVRDELVLSPIVISQDIIDYGIKLYLGSGDSTVLSFYEPALTIDYGVVNTTL